MKYVKLLLLLAWPALTATGWPDTPSARVKALTMLQTLNAELLSHDSATLVLDDWCESHRLASLPQVFADRVHGEGKPASAEIRALLQVDAATPVAYRHMQLRCGTIVLSDTENWYVPARLTPEMNQALETGDAPFGRIARPLGFHRQSLSARYLWSPFPPSWRDKHRLGALEIPFHVMEHRALLALPDGTPISTVIENYRSSVLGSDAN